MPLYSHSQLRTFETCPLKYKFRYIDKIEPPFEQTAETFLGSLVHAVLDKLYRDVQFQKLNSLEELLAYYHDLWAKEWGPGIQIVQEGLTEQNFFDTGAECIRNYYARHHPFRDSRTLETEVHLVFALDAKREYQMQGVVDRLARRSDGTYEVHDYKTSRRLPSQETLDSDRQLALYQVGLKYRWPDAERAELVWHYLRHDMEFRSTRTPEQLQRLCDESAQLIGCIRVEKDFEPRKSELCDWCEFRPLCPLWKHVSAVETLPPAEFALDDGVRLVDQYAQTKAQKDELDVQLAMLRDEIIDFARQKGFRIVQGHGARVTISTTERTKFPGKDEPEREALEQFLRDTGKWDEVARLDVHELARVLGEEGWPGRLLERVRQFATSESSTTVRITRTAEPPEE